MRKIKILLFLSLFGSYIFTYADFDKKIEDTCRTYNVEASKKCMWVLKAQMRFETWYLKKVRNNNLFNFRSPWIKKIWRENFWVIWINNWYLVFSDKTKSIEFAVNRFYLYDVNDSIEKIVDDFCTAPKNIKKNYVQLIKEYVGKEYTEKKYFTTFLCRLFNNNFKNANKQQSSKMIYRGFNFSK